MRKGKDPEPDPHPDPYLRLTDVKEHLKYFLHTVIYLVNGWVGAKNIWDYTVKKWKLSFSLSKKK